MTSCTVVQDWIHCLSKVPLDSQRCFWTALDADDKHNFRLASKACAQIADQHLTAVSLSLTPDAYDFIKALPSWTRLVQRLRGVRTWRLCATHGLTQALQAMRLSMLVETVGRKPFMSITCMHLASGIIINTDAKLAGLFPNLRSLHVADLLQENQESVLSALEDIVGPRLEVLRIDGGDVYDSVALLHMPLDAGVPVHLAVPASVPMQPLPSLVRCTPGLRALSISFDQVNGLCRQARVLTSQSVCQASHYTTLHTVYLTVHCCCQMSPQHGLVCKLHR